MTFFPPLRRGRDGCIRLNMVEEIGSPEYLTVKEAAEYIGVSAQTLRRWDASGKLRSIRRRPSGYRYYRRTDLEPFRLEYSRAEMPAEDAPGAHLFQVAPADVEHNENLREPQREAHTKTRRHFVSQGGPALLQIPVGCGKTGVIATLPFGIAEGRVLVIAPNVTIRKSIAEALDLASPECFWTKTRVLSSFRHGPFLAVLDGPDANIHDCTESHFVLTNIQQLASSADRWLPQFPPNFFDLILVDEAHHNVAASWKKVFQRFPEAKVVGLTATPFRGDEQPLAGEVIYRYSFTRAMLKGYIKQIVSRNVAPAVISFTYRDEQRRHSLEEVLRLREERWFSKGVALAPECNQHIAEASIQRCNALRAETGIQHQVIAVACSVDHARQVRRVYEQCGYRAREIHSDMPEETRDEVLSDLELGRLDAIVQVQMLGEGFDHPRLSVAAIFRPFRSLAPYIQFVGRIMRVIHQNKPDHPDNRGFVVSHVGLNNDEHWDDFRELDLEDQELLRRWVHGDSDDDGGGEGEGQGSPRRFDAGMLVDAEIVSHFVQQAFLDPDDDRVLEQLLAQPIGSTGLAVGNFIGKEDLRAKLREQLKAMEEKPEPIPVSPQRRRRAVRARLDEREGSVVARILRDLSLSRAGRDVARALPKIGRGQANLPAVTRMLKRAVNEAIGIPSGSRRKPKSGELERAFTELDAIGDRVRDRIRTALEEKRDG
ncbi:MAG: DEAD/DEAH box helicase family protein [Polyangiaceae bacterium]|nr:DEAD/DEAH box helicase family protein [Polyangiaceae bacterium]